MLTTFSGTVYSVRFSFTASKILLTIISLLLSDGSSPSVYWLQHVSPHFPVTVEMQWSVTWYSLKIHCHRYFYAFFKYHFGYIVVITKCFSRNCCYRTAVKLCRYRKLRIRSAFIGQPRYRNGIIFVFSYVNTGITFLFLQPESGISITVASSNTIVKIVFFSRFSHSS